MANIAKRADGRWRARYRDTAGKEHARHFARRSTRSVARLGDHRRRHGPYVDPSRAKVTVGTMAEQWFAGKINLRVRPRRSLPKRTAGPRDSALGRRAP